MIMAIKTFRFLSFLPEYFNVWDSNLFCLLGFFFCINLKIEVFSMKGFVFEYFHQNNQSKQDALYIGNLHVFLELMLFMAIIYTLILLFASTTKKAKSIFLKSNLLRTFLNEKQYHVLLNQLFTAISYEGMCLTRIQSLK